MTTGKDINYYVEKAWEIINKNYLDMCKEERSLYGKGISIFNFLDTASKDHNCEHNYIIQDDHMWSHIIEKADNYDEIMKTYNENLHYLILISLPTKIKEFEFIGNTNQIRIFNL